MAVGEWDQRQLCPDGGCVGVIGPDGTCKVCGRAAQNWGDERKRGLIDPPDEDEDEDDLAADANDADDEEDADDADDSDPDADDSDPDAPVHALAPSSSWDEWGSRQLCAEGSCIGVIGADGTCHVCGRAAPGSRGAAASGPAAAVATEPGAADKPDGRGGGAPPSDAPLPGDPDATDRTRCSDPACSGMTGVEGHCEVCGKVGA